MNGIKPLKYVLVTAARNEERFIIRVIQSVVSQTVLPKRWIIVSDGSIDRTDAIVRTFAQSHPWIELLRMSEHRDRSFAAKAVCFNAAYARLKRLDFDLIGNVDADITFEVISMSFSSASSLRCRRWGRGHALRGEPKPAQ
jgi:glycosyltransferase involved in cell wall biosynthesis